MNDIIATLIAAVPFASLATVGPNGQPLSTIVTTTYRDGCVYWFSPSTTDHSQNIARDNRVSIVVFDQTHQQKDVVYVESVATIVDKTDAQFDGLFPDQAVRNETMNLYQVHIGDIDPVKSQDDRHYFKGTTV